MLNHRGTETQRSPFDEPGNCYFDFPYPALLCVSVPLWSRILNHRGPETQGTHVGRRCVFSLAARASENGPWQTENRRLLPLPCRRIDCHGIDGCFPISWKDQS